MQCSVTGITHKGEGVGRMDGQAVFIPFAIPGETVEVEVRERKKNYLRAQLVEVVSASSDRVAAPCLYYYRCGGCAYQHMNYSRQMDLKRRVVQDNLARIGGLEAEVEPVAGMNDPWRYRNKVEWQVAKEDHYFRMGYHIQDSHQLIPIEACLLISPAMEALSKHLRERLDDLRLPDHSRIAVRQSSANGELMLVIAGIGSGEADVRQLAKYPGLSSIYCIDQGRIIHKHGRSSLTERLAGIDYQISPLAFFQVNHQQAELLVDVVRQFAQLGPADNVLEGYCGIGSITLPLARSAGRIVGVESYLGAVQDARENARRNNITNCEFIAGACEKVIPNMKERFDVVILDPPRAGCKKEVIEAVIKAAPQRIVYVSCNPGTLARDLKIFCQDGYTVKKVQPIDMFPQTSHVETVVLLSKGEIDSKKVRVEFSLEDMDMSEFQDGATYPQIKEYVLEHTGLKVSNLYISQIKRKCGLEVGKNYNLPKSEDSRQPQCPPEKEKAIREAFKYFGMI